jgi:transcriptional regulator with XRE-family HTH domain
MIQLLDRMLIRMAFPERLSHLRKQRGLTQESLGDLVGLAKLQIYRYEKGTSQPTMAVLKQIAIALNTSIDELVFTDNERDPQEDLKLRFELIQQMGKADQDAIKSILDGMIIKHQTRVTMDNLEK